MGHIDENQLHELNRSVFISLNVTNAHATVKRPVASLPIPGGGSFSSVGLKIGVAVLSVRLS